MTICHSERSEESISTAPKPTAESPWILRYVQNDTLKRIGVLAGFAVASLSAAAADLRQTFSGATPLEWSQQLAQSEIARRGTTLNYQGSPKARWDYTTGIFSYALLKLADETGGDAAT